MPREGNEKDWKLFRSRLPGWQEAYMEKLVGEYKALLDSDKAASEKYWALERRIGRDKRNPGVLLEDVRKSQMERHLLLLLRHRVIGPEDLEGFSDELRERLAWVTRDREEEADG